MRPALEAWLERAWSLGFVGGAPDEQVARADAFADAFAEAGLDPPARALDLGTGAGLPGLVLADRWPGSQWVLLDRSARRTGPLGVAVEQLGLSSRVRVASGDAEVLAHDPDLRGGFDAVVCRGFGPPALAAECAAGFLRPAGVLAVAEPPDEARSSARWSAEGLVALGLQIGDRHGSIQFIRRADEVPGWAPRRPAAMRRQPTF